MTIRKKCTCTDEDYVMNCDYLAVVRGAERGVMDADPDEYICFYYKGECVMEEENEDEE